jgi:hypothetical protein
MRTARWIIRVGSFGLVVCVCAPAGLAQPADEAPAEAAPTATERALEELSSAYQSLAGLLETGSDEAVDRVQGDIENLGDWEYRIVELEDTGTEALEDELNALGNERWETYWVEPTRDGIRFYLKRPSVSYLSRVPLSTLLRMLAAGGQ